MKPLRKSIDPAYLQGAKTPDGVERPRILDREAGQDKIGFPHQFFVRDFRYFFLFDHGAGTSLSPLARKGQLELVNNL